MTSSFPVSSAIADVLSIRGLPGVLSPPLVDFTGVHVGVHGLARTVQMTPTDQPGSAFEALYALLDEDLRNAAVIVAGAEEVPGAVWGQILSRAAERSGASAALIGGAVRDRATLPGEGLTVWACAERTVGAIGLAKVTAVDEPVRIGDVEIRQGDEVIADAAGVVCLPQELAAGVCADAAELVRGEDALLTDLAKGAPLHVAYAHKRRVAAKLHGATNRTHGGQDG